MTQVSYIAEQSDALADVLESFGIKIAELDPSKAQVGPSVVRYRVKLAPGSKVSKLRSSAEDIGRELSCKTAPIIDNIPGEPFVGVDLARPNRVVEYLAPALAKLPETGLLDLNVAAGVTPGGEDIIIKLTKLPHMLVAGSTASGKTVFLHSLLLSLLSRLSSEDIEILIVDPKATDFSIYRNVPHLRGGKVFTESEDAIKQIRKLTSVELTNRTKVLQSAEVPNISEYNSKNYSPLMKPIVVIIDEYADLLSVLSKSEKSSFEGEIVRLAQRARSVGIHLVIATQRPGTDTLSGLLKANIPCRVAFRLPQRVDSQTALDSTGAENLLGMGDMLFKSDVTQRLQGYFMPSEEISELLNTLFPPKPKRGELKSPKVEAKLETRREPSAIHRFWRKALRILKITAFTVTASLMAILGTFGYLLFTD